MKTSRALLALSLLLSVVAPLSAKVSTTVQTECGDYNYWFEGAFKPESFFGKNIALLNKNNCDIDKVFFSRHTLDLKFGLNTPSAKFKIATRNRGIWGNPGSIARTTDAETKVVDAVGRKHKHSIPRHIFWMREGWMEFDLAQFLGLGFENDHIFSLGAFPYQLGRGIALGSAYAVGPEFLGFYTDSVVDQYAFGAKFSGDIVKDALHYDLYAAILQNKSTSIGETGAKIYGQEYGRIMDPARGFGKINFLVATNLDWTAYNGPRGKVNLSLYGLHNSDPEQKIEFLGDASSKLGTIGFATKYQNDSGFELGFETAVNFGYQRVKGWDRNQVKEKNDNGNVVLVNTHVVDDNGNAIPFVGSRGEAQQIIDTTFESEKSNGQVIGTTAGDVGSLTAPVTLVNKGNRFRDPYLNTFHGWMFVGDIAYWVNDTMRWGLEAGVASGDDNPNTDTMDGRYDGFIPLQSIYSGNKIKSAFVLGGAGKLRRPLATPESNQSPSRFSTSVSGFTNIVYAGTSYLYKPKWERGFSIMPNYIAYWQENAIKKFDAATKQDLDCPASKYLGSELNVFMDYNPFCNMKFYCVGSVFFPGSHYTDIKGKPLSSAQEAQLDRLDRTGFEEDRIPNIGDDTAWTINAGIEFKF